MKRYKLYNNPNTASSGEVAAAQISVQTDGNEKDHFPHDFNLGNYRKYLIPLGIYLLITLVVFWPMTLNITSTVAAGRPGASIAGTADLYQNLWSMWWVNYAIFNLHTSPYYTKLLFYPVGASLVTETLSPLSAMFSYAFQGVSAAFAYNIVLIVDFALAGLFTFMLADYVIKNKYAAFIAGTVFAFSAFHMAHAMEGQINWIGIEFFPLFILFFLLMVKEKKIYYIIGTSVSFILLVFFGDPEQGIMGLLFIALLMLLSLFNNEDRKDILSRKFAVSAAAALLLTIVLGSPFLIPIATSILHGNALGLANGSSNIENNMIWSSPLLSFFLPSPVNSLLTPVSDLYSSIYNYVGNEDRIVYIGWTAIILALFGAVADFRKNKLRNTMVWIILGAFFAWLSLGPYLQIGALTQYAASGKTLPGIYLIYRQIPIFNLIREPARFNLIVTLCMALLAGFGFREVESRMNRGLPGRNKLNYIAMLVVVLFVAESSGIPLPGNYISLHFLKLNIPSVYYNLSDLKSNFSVVTLPILASYSSLPEIYTSEAMYYQTAFKKPLVGGFTTRENTTDQYIRLNMPLSVEAASLQAGGLFAYVSPINESYTNLTLFFLSRYNVRYISVINGAYNFTDLQILDNYLDSTFGNPVYRDNATGIWLVNGTVQEAKGKSIVSYISLGNWTYGCSALGSIKCNSTIDRLWYGPNLRAINVSVPSNDTSLYMTFSVASLNSNVTLYVFQTSDRHELGAARLTRNVTSYGLNLTLSPGITSLFFVAANSTEPNADHAYDFGIDNITIKSR